MLKAFFTFTLGTICGVLIARKVHNLFHFESLRSISPKRDLNKKILVTSSTVDEQRRQ